MRLRSAATSSAVVAFAGFVGRYLENLSGFGFGYHIHLYPEFGFGLGVRSFGVAYALHHLVQFHDDFLQH